MLATVATAAPPPTGVPEYDVALNRGIAWLKQRLEANPPHGGERSLAAVALLTAGEPPTLPIIQAAVKDARDRVQSTGYKPTNSEHHIYEAGVDCMLLVAASAGDNKDQIAAIAQYIIAQQGADGSWDYPARTVGDTSMAQYGVLGLWAAKRAGANVPLEVWDKCAMWHLKTQQSDGGFMYHPGVNVNEATGGGKSSINMTPGGAGSLAIAKLHLYPESMFGGKRPKKFGILDEKDDPAKNGPPYTPQTSLAAIDNGLQKSMGWLASHYMPITNLPHKVYYNFALERACALNFVTLLGGKVDWFRSSGDQLLKLQKADGSWDDFLGPQVGTAFAILFYIRPAKKAVAEYVAGGMQTGGRGLPDDLAAASSRKGKIQERKPKGALDEMLSDLASADAALLEDAQSAIVEKVQIGDRNELLGQMETVRKLANHPSAEVRKTAIWALGRSGKINDAMYLIRALNDDDVDVLLEANAALKYLSRKLSGVGVPESPYVDLPENANEAQKIAAVASWRKEALKRWTAWYTRVRPFNERNDLFEFLNRTTE
jgi:hypothetical protein